MANQYGIDLAGVEGKVSALKTAKLNRQINEENLKNEKEDRTNRLAQIARTNKNVLSMASNTKGMEGYDVQTATDFDMINKFLANADTKQKQAVLAKVQTLGKYSIAILNSQDPQQKQAMWKELEAIIPPSIRGDMPKEYDKNWLTLNATKAKSISDMIREKLAKQKTIDAQNKVNSEYTGRARVEKLKAKLKQQTDAKNEKQKQVDKIAFENIKGRAGTQGTKKEFQQIMDILDNPNLSPEKRKFYKARAIKLSQTDRTSLLINMNTVKEAQSNFANTLNLDSPYKLASIDTRKLSPEQQAEGNQLSSVIIKGLGANAKQVEKKMGEYSAMAGQMKNAMLDYEEVGNFRAADEATKKYFSNYFGLSPEELKSTKAAMAFQSMLNIKIKADSGSAVSGNEMVRNTLETATPFMNKGRILLGIKNVAKRQLATLQGLKKVMGPVAFNLKYGAIMSNYKDITNAVEKETSTDSLEILRGTKKQDVTKMSDTELLKLIGK